MARTRRKRRLTPGDQPQYKDDHSSSSTRFLLALPKSSWDNDSRYASNLCHKCSLIDFEAIYQLDPKKLPSEGVPVVDLSCISLTGTAFDCELCYMVTRILSQNRTISDFPEKSFITCYLRAFSCLSVLGTARTQRRLAQSPSIVIAVVPSRFESAISIQMRDASLATGVILPTLYLESIDVQSQRLSYIGRQIYPDRIDFSVINSWLKECSSQHAVCVDYEELMRSDDGSSVAATPDLLVIDVETRIMTKLPPGSSYVAMSYVWGANTAGTSVTAVYEGDKLPYPQPRLVEDALIVVRKLEERFLWLDRYSIDQADVSAKQKAILNMADIFEKATLVIVSLAPNVDVGLWGVSSASRTPQPRAVSGGLQLVSSGLVLEDALQHSVWSRRCWTLQEALLTRKMLIFSEDQIYWKCSTIIQIESVEQLGIAAMLGKKIIRHPNLELFSEASQHRKRFGEMPLPVYARQVAEYTKRELSYSSDALNAFRAILSRSGETTFWGIPIYKTRESVNHESGLTDTGFLLGLLWSRSAHKWYKPWQEFTSTRRPKIESRTEFPSWSWTSTSHCVQFDPISFDQKLSDEHGGLFAATYRHSPYAIPHAKVELLGRGSPARILEEYYSDRESPYGPEEAAEYALPCTLRLTAPIVSWRMDQSGTASLPPTFSISFQFPSSTWMFDEKEWFRHGVLFIDNDSEARLMRERDFEGKALLLVRYRRYGYNWLHVVWWIAIKETLDGWRRIGLIRSVHEVNEPRISAKHVHSSVEKDHRRPFLPLSLELTSTRSYPPEKEDLETFIQTIDLI